MSTYENMEVFLAFLNHMELSGWHGSLGSDQAPCSMSFELLGERPLVVRARFDS